MPCSIGRRTFSSTRAGGTIVKRIDVANLAGVSEATVSYVINGRAKVSEDTRRKVMSAMEQLHYRPNSLARSLKTRKTMQIAVLISYLGNPFEAGILLHLEQSAQAAGYILVFQSYQPNMDPSVMTSLQNRVDGLIVLGQALDEEGRTQLQSSGLPFLYLLTPGGIENHLDPVLDVDWIGSYRMLLSELIKRGHRRIGFLGNGDQGHYHEHRYFCFQQAMKLMQIDWDSEDYIVGSGRLEAAEAAVLSFMERSHDMSFTALVCANDLMAIGAISACRTAGVAVPEKLSIIGSEDILMASHSNPPLAALRVPRKELGQRGFAMMLELIEKSDTISEAIISSEWISRDSLQ